VGTLVVARGGGTRCGLERVARGGVARYGLDVVACGGVARCGVDTVARGGIRLVRSRYGRPIIAFDRQILQFIDKT